MMMMVMSRSLVSFVFAVCSASKAPSLPALEPPDLDDTPESASAASLFNPFSSARPGLPGLPSLGGHPGDGNDPHSGPAEISFGLWDVFRPGEWERRKLVNKSKGEWGQMATEVVFREPDKAST